LLFELIFTLWSSLEGHLFVFFNPVKKYTLKINVNFYSSIAGNRVLILLPNRTLFKRLIVIELFVVSIFSIVIWSLYRRKEIKESWAQKVQISVFGKKKQAQEKIQKKVDAKYYAELEAQRKSDRQAYAEAKIESDLQEQREQNEREANRVINTLALMRKSLPFYCSVTDEEGTESYSGKLRWQDTLEVVQVNDKSDGTLYFVKLLSLLGNQEYYKIGITKKSVEERFETSTQIELLEVVATFTAARYLVLFLGYHFIREFEVTSELNKLPDMSGPDVRFSGSSELVRSNAKLKIGGFFENLKDYEDKVIKGVVELV